MAKADIDNTVWEELGLRADPFPLTPTPESEFVWAGQAQLKAELDDILKQGTATDSTQFVGLVAPWGSGKTHALGYYSHAKNRPHTDFKAVAGMKFLQVTFPKSEKQIAEGFFHRVVDKLGWDAAVRDVVDFGRTHEKDFAKTIADLLQDNSDLIRAFDYLRKPDLDEATSFNVKSYLFGQASKRERDRLRFVRPGNTVEERYLALNAFFALESGWKSDKRTRVVLWIDEAENLIKLSSSNFDPFTQGLRDVLDISRKVYGCLTVIINFTPESKNFEGEMYAILGSALYDRLDKKITIQPMTSTEGRTFVEDVLKGYAKEPSKPQRVFATDALELLPTIWGDSVTPRRVNRVCSAILHAVLTERDPIKRFPVTREKIKELMDTQKIASALSSERPGA